MTRYRLTSAAVTELKQATLYYEQREGGLGVVFVNEIEAAVLAFFKILPPGTRCHPEQDVVELIAFRLV